MKITLTNYWKRFFSKLDKYEYQVIVRFVYLNSIRREFFVEDEDEVLVEINYLDKLVNIDELTNLMRKNRINFSRNFSLMTYVELYFRMKDYKEARFCYQMQIEENPEVRKN